MVKKIIYVLVFFLSTICIAMPDFASEDLRNVVSAEQIQVGCSISFSKQFYPSPDDPLSVPPFDVLAMWSCKDGDHSRLDLYERNGGNPEIVTVTYWKNRDIIVTVKWSVNSQAADYVGDYYKVFVYRGSSRGDEHVFAKDEAAMGKFPAGWDGYTQSGSPLHYSFKNAGAIRKRLLEIHYDD